MTSGLQSPLAFDRQVLNRLVRVARDPAKASQALRGQTELAL